MNEREQHHRSAKKQLDESKSWLVLTHSPANVPNGELILGSLFIDDDAPSEVAVALQLAAFVIDILTEAEKQEQAAYDICSALVAVKMRHRQVSGATKH